MIKYNTINGKKQFYVDIGNFPVDKAMEYVNQIIEKQKSKKN